MEERLAQLESRLDRIESQLSRLTGLMERRSDQLDYAINGLGAAPELLGEAADTIRALTATSTDIDERVRGSLAVLESVTAPDALHALVTISDMLASNPGALTVLAELAGALDEAPAVSQPIGPLGLLTVLRDPEVQRVLGIVLAVTRRLGRSV